MSRYLVALVAICAATACKRPPKPGDPLPGLSAAERAQFDSGRAVFDSVFTPQTGLGPLFNANACGECHEDPVSGGTGDEVERHATAFRAVVPPGTRQCDELVEQGGFVFANHVTPALHDALRIDSEPVPAAATLAHRTTPEIFGFGLLDAVPDSEILAYADPDDSNHDGISGRPNRTFDGRVGRFGRKALVPTLREFNLGAFSAEQGITTPAVPTEETVAGKPVPPSTDPAPDPELSDAKAELATAFVRLLAPPAPLKMSGEAREGRDVFTRIGCASCHRPSFTTGDSPIAALSHKQVDAYTDLLLHDMGAELGDICLALATPTEFRTEPLMGLHLKKTFLHDGRATTVEEAVGLHGGEATRARDLFRALAPRERAALIAFVRAL